MDAASLPAARVRGMEAFEARQAAGASLLGDGEASGEDGRVAREARRRDAEKYGEEYIEVNDNDVQ